MTEHDITAGQLVAVLAVLAQPACTRTDREPIGSSLEYERFVEAPRRHGIDPVWEAMLNEAFAANPQRIHRAS